MIWKLDIDETGSFEGEPSLVAGWLRPDGISDAQLRRRLQRLADAGAPDPALARWPPHARDWHGDAPILRQMVVTAHSTTEGASIAVLAVPDHAPDRNLRVGQAALVLTPYLRALIALLKRVRLCFLDAGPVRVQVRVATRHLTVTHNGARIVGHLTERWLNALVRESELPAALRPRSDVLFEVPASVQNYNACAPAGLVVADVLAHAYFSTRLHSASPHSLARAEAPGVALGFQCHIERQDGARPSTLSAGEAHEAQIAARAPARGEAWVAKASATWVGVV